MPYRSEHALRLEDPSKFIKYRRTSGGTIYGSLTVPKTIDVIWGHIKGSPKEAFIPQALRFPVMKWTEKQAKDWIKKNIKDYILFDPSPNTKQDLKTNFSMDLKTNYRQLPIYKITPMEAEFTEIAITDNPAIEEYFLKFTGEEIKLDFNSDKRVITGPVMIPNKLIYRNDALGERFVTYDEEGIQKAAALFMKNGLKFNSEHTETILPIEIIESYFANIPNKFNTPQGSWIVSAKVNDLELWGKLKENNMGFSFQALFSNELIGTEQINFNNNNKEEMNLKEKLSAAINAVLFGEVTPEVIVPEVAPEISTEEFAAGDPVVPEAPVAPEVPVVEDVEVITEEKVQEMINEAVMSATEQIMVAVKELMNQSTETATAMSAMSARLEEFSKQPLSEPITETVINTPTDSNFNYLKGVSLK